MRYGTRYGTGSGRADDSLNFNLPSTSTQAFGANGHGTRYGSKHLCCPLRSLSIKDLKADRRRSPVFVITWLLRLTLYNWQPRDTYEAAATIMMIRRTDMLPHEIMKSAGAQQIPMVGRGSVAVQLSDSRQSLRPFLDLLDLLAC
jgi:hypothetical protein